MKRHTFIIAALALWPLALLGGSRYIDNAPCFHPMGENLRLCFIHHEIDGRLVLEFERRVRNAWFQTRGDGLVEVWFDRADIGNAKRAILWRLDAREGVTEPGIGISTDPGYVAARVTGTLLTIEDVVYE